MVVYGDVAVRAAQQVTKTIPIVVATDDIGTLAVAAGRQYNGHEHPRG